jgi:crotonobetainyl-CoA:carnitine CoA-transferase CaiB-like acyl-CoA transferase
MTLSGLALTRYLSSGVNVDEWARRPSEQIHGVYEAKDGYVAIRVIGEKAINAVAETLGIEAEDVTPESEALKGWLRERSREEITGLLAEKIPCSPVLTDEELVEDPNVIDRGMIVEREHPLGFKYRTVATGVRFSETPTRMELPPPGLGADTVEVLKGLGYDEEEIRTLIDEGAAGAPSG